MKIPVFTNENQMQIFIAQWIEQKTTLDKSFFHFANERKTSWTYGKILKLMGVQAGVLDCFISKPTEHFSGLWIEIKMKGKKPSKEQLEFIENRIDEGYWAFWSDDVEDIIDQIKGFYPNQLL